ncbi:MAG: glycosyltransferase family 39 protein [Anaerolineae bacterium]
MTKPPAETPGAAPASRAAEGNAAAPKPPGVSPTLVGALGVLAVVVVTGVVYARWLSTAQWDPDEGILLGWAQLLGRGFRMYTDIWSDQPPGLAVSLVAGFRLFGESVESGRLVVLAYGLVGMVGAALLAGLLGESLTPPPPLPQGERGARWVGPIAAVAAAMLLAVVPNFFWLARSVSHDIPPIGVGTLAVALALLYARTGRLDWLVAAGALLGWAVWLKLTGAVFAIPLLAMAAGRLWQAQNPWREALRGLLALALGATLAALPFLLFFDVGGFLDQAILTPLRARDAWGSNKAYNVGWLVQYLFRDNVGLTALAALGAVALLVRRSYPGAVAVGWLLLTALILSNQEPLFPTHHLALLLPPLAALAGAGVGALWLAIRTPRRAGWLLAPGVVALAVLVVNAPAQAASLADAVTNDKYTSYLKAADWMRENTAPGDFVLADPPMIAFRSGRLQAPWLVDQSSKRIDTGQLDWDATLAEIERRRPAAIALWLGHFDKIPNFTDWLKMHYVTGLRSGDRAIWVPLEDAPITPQGGRFGENATLLGYTLETNDERTRLTLYLRALTATATPYKVVARLVDGAGRVVDTDEGEPDDGYAPTTTWPAGRPVADRQKLSFPVKGQGEYRVQVGLADTQTNTFLPAFDAEGGPLGDTLTLDTVVHPSPGP